MSRKTRTILIITAALLALLVISLAVWFARDLPPVRRFEMRGVALAHVHRGTGGYGSDDCRAQFKAITELGGNWIALTDFAFMPRVDQPELRHGRGGSFSEHENLRRAIDDAHAAGLKVLLKPHVWSAEFSGGKKWHADIKMSNEADWDSWFAQYTNYVLDQAKLAQLTGVEALCVGCELEGTTLTQEKRWRSLVAEIRKVYSGKLTYSALYLEVGRMAWWDALDVVGISAYWKVTDVELAGEAQLRRGWRRLVREELNPIHKRWNKPVWFTELGYTASSKAGMSPWHYGVENPDQEYQARLLRVAMEEASRAHYVQGVFIWKWYSSDRFTEVEPNEPFAVQNRPGPRKVIGEAFRYSPPTR